VAITAIPAAVRGLARPSASHAAITAAVKSGVSIPHVDQTTNAALASTIHGVTVAGQAGSACRHSANLHVSTRTAAPVAMPSQCDTVGASSPSAMPPATSSVQSGFENASTRSPAL
jgi:hypothetical protein